MGFYSKDHMQGRRCNVVMGWFFWGWETTIRSLPCLRTCFTFGCVRLGRTRKEDHQHHRHHIQTTMVPIKSWNKQTVSVRECLQVLSMQSSKGAQKFLTALAYLYSLTCTVRASLRAPIFACAGILADFWRCRYGSFPKEGDPKIDPKIL